MDVSCHHHHWLQTHQVHQEIPDIFWPSESHYQLGDFRPKQRIEIRRVQLLMAGWGWLFPTPKRIIADTPKKHRKCTKKTKQKTCLTPVIWHLDFFKNFPTFPRTTSQQKWWESWAIPHQFFQPLFFYTAFVWFCEVHVKKKSFKKSRLVSDSLFVSRVPWIWIFTDYL